MPISFTLSEARSAESKRSRWTAAVGLGVFLLVATATTARADPLPPEQTSQIDASIRAALALRPNAGLSVGVSWRGLEWSAGYGYAQLSPTTVKGTHTPLIFTNHRTLIEQRPDGPDEPHRIGQF
jgi:hypothetical protein